MSTIYAEDRGDGHCLVQLTSAKRTVLNFPDAMVRETEKTEGCRQKLEQVINSRVDY